jgi:ribonuclease HI
MNYDRNQTGGNGFVIEFPDTIEIDPIQRSLRNDRQGIHRLEMISIIEAMEELLVLAKREPEMLRRAAAVEIYTDRIRVTDDYLANPYAIRDWRKNGWKNHEGKATKDSDLLDKIDKTRLKLSKAVGGSVSISYKREKNNKVADKLSKAGKTTANRGRKIFVAKQRRVTRRIYDGQEVGYGQIGGGTIFEARVYAWELVRKQVEVCFEACSGKFEGCIVKAMIEEAEKSGLHRGHIYLIEVDAVFKHHIRIIVHEEIER